MTMACTPHEKNDVRLLSRYYGSALHQLNNTRTPETQSPTYMKML